MLASLKEMLVNILNRAEIWVPGDNTLDRIGYFVIAAKHRALQSFTNCVPRNLRSIAFIFKPNWNLLSDDDAEFVLEWLSRGFSVTARAFIPLFNAVAVKPLERSELQINVVRSYMNMLDASTENEEQALKAFKTVAENPLTAAAPLPFRSLAAADPSALAAGIPNKPVSSCWLGYLAAPLF